MKANDLAEGMLHVSHPARVVREQNMCTILTNMSNTSDFDINYKTIHNTSSGTYQESP